ncbi:hypothetical protein [Endozoicomonas sp. SESOKO1]|uniref:hypothetical protein n=1 Tax=Endozoicomonas sp. SESOKO1 TaxID=2828742 RepID=UPI00214723FD|nr:hypothetical protein [Endozoicomonas sp. SESOKO1]
MPVELVIQPMTALEKSVLADETCLKQHIGRFKSRYVTDGLLHALWRLPDTIRDQLLPPLPLLTLEQRHCVGRITYIDDHKNHLWSIDRVMTSVLDQNSKSELRFHLEPVMENKAGLATAESRGKIAKLDASSIVVVRDSNSVDADEDADKKDVKCLTSQQLKEGSYLGVYQSYEASDIKSNLHYGGGQSVTLSAGEGVVLEYKVSEGGLPYWDKVAAYHHEERMVQMNPLLQERLDFNDTTTSNGEYYLPVRAIKELSVLKRKSGTCPAVYYCGLVNDGNSLKALKKYISGSIANGSGMAAFSILVMNASASHMTAVRFIQVRNKFVVYLHETIQPDCPLATETRNFIIHGISCAVENIQDNRLYFLTTPASGYLQKDYHSCTMMAFKVLLSFDKERNGLDSFFIQLVEDAHSGTSPVDYRAFPAEGSGKQGKRARRRPENIKVGAIPLASLPAVLLKFYQGSQDHVSDAQKKTMVSHARKLTLEEYYLRHGFMDPDTGKTLNMAAFCKTNKTLTFWKDMLRNFTPLFIRILKPDFGKASKLSINRWLRNSMYSDIEINGHDLKMLKRYKNFVTMEAELNVWPDGAFLKWLGQSHELMLWLKRLRSNAMTMGVNKLLWRWCQFLNNYLDPNSEVGRLWVRRDVCYVIERLDARLKLLRKTGRSDFSFHAGERVYREPVCRSGPLFEGEPIYRDSQRFYIKTEVKESLTEPGRFNRIVMIFPKPLLLAPAEHERVCQVSGSGAAEAIDKVLSGAWKSAISTSVPEAFSRLDSSESGSSGATLAIADAHESMDIELSPEKKITVSSFISQDHSPVKAATPDKPELTAIHSSLLDQGHYPVATKVKTDSTEMDKETVRRCRIKSLPPLKRERTELVEDFPGCSRKKRRLLPAIHGVRHAFEPVLKRSSDRCQGKEGFGHCFPELPTVSRDQDLTLSGDLTADSLTMNSRNRAVPIPSGDTAAPDMAGLANSIRRTIEGDECKIAFEMLSMMLKGKRTQDFTGKAKACRRLNTLKQAIQKICEISKLTNKLDNHLKLKNVPGIPGLHESQKGALRISFTLDYLFQMLCAAGERLVNEPLAIVTAARLFIVRNSKGIDDGGLGEQGRFDLRAGKFPALLETASSSELTENQSARQRADRIRKELKAIAYLMVHERINTNIFRGTVRGKIKLVNLLIDKVCFFSGTKNGSQDFLGRLKFEESTKPSQRQWIKIAALHEYLSSILPGHSTDKSLASILLTAERYLKEQAESIA